MYDHITPVLINLHWLPARYRINFKILLLTFKALYSMAPTYIIDLFILNNIQNNRICDFKQSLKKAVAYFQPLQTKDNVHLDFLVFWYSEEV